MYFPKSVLLCIGCIKINEIFITPILVASSLNEKFPFSIELLMAELECLYRVPDALANIFFIAALMRPLKLGSIS